MWVLNLKLVLEFNYIRNLLPKPDPTIKLFSRDILLNIIYFCTSN